MRWRIVPLVLGALAFPRSAGACSYSDGGFTQDGTKTGAAPGPVADISYSVQRGKGPTGGCGRSMATSCDDIGAITLHFTAATDADSKNTEVGYRVSFVGKAPAGLTLPDAPSPPYFEQDDDRDATVWLHWADGATDDQEHLDFTLTITPVDSHGNVGPTSAPIHVIDDGSGGCGLRRNGAGPDAFASALALTGAVLLRRRASARRR
jgi:hypothetical protein